MRGCKEKVSNPDARLKACFHPPQWPRRSLQQQQLHWVDRMTWQSVGYLVRCAEVHQVSRLSLLLLLCHSSPIHWKSKKFCGSRVLCRTAGVELSRRRAGCCCDCSSPPAVPWCRQVGAGTPAFLPPTNRMSQTDTRTQGDERRGLVKFGARGEKCKIVWAQRAKLQKWKNNTYKVISAKLTKCKLTKSRWTLGREA